MDNLECAVQWDWELNEWIDWKEVETKTRTLPVDQLRQTPQKLGPFCLFDAEKELFHTVDDIVNDCVTRHQPETPPDLITSSST